MKVFVRLLATAIGFATLPVHAVVQAQSFPRPLPEESIPSVTPLPAQWPKSWVLINDLHFNSLVDGRVVVVDTASADQPLKGIIRAAQFANMLISKKRGEILTSETFILD
ncbi:hypothetical protein P0F65_10565 [Sphingomonas sp. I4]